MNTAAATQFDNEGFTTVNPPELFRFDNIGTEIRGILRSIEDVEIKDEKTGKTKATPQAVLEAESGSGSVKILLTYDLQQKLTRGMIGHVVKIKYVGTDEGAGREGNAMRVFEVKFKK